MTFDSYAYLVLLALTVALFHGLPGRARAPLLLLASITFYAWWNPPYVLLLVGIALLDYVAARRIAATDVPRTRRTWLALSVVGNLGILGFFKYADFVLQNLRWALPAGDALPASLSILLPIGISFHTFQAMSYTVDVYRREAEPAPTFARFFLYVMFFPQLVAGPIERARRLLPQILGVERLGMPRGAWATGTLLVLWGLFQKCALADNLAPVADAVFAEPKAFGGGALALGVVAFAFQIYFDFSGYCDVARGSARLLGIDLVLNFRRPYLATSPTDFWRRWHVSLSEWFRDYVYVPLGGNRRGRARAALNVLVVMGLAGLWHGAAWTFVAWGLYHGALIVLHRLVGPWLPAAPAGWPAALHRGIRVATTFVLVCGGWVLFRAERFADAMTIYRGIGGGALAALSSLDPATWARGGAGLAAAAALLALARIEEARGLAPRLVSTAPGYWAVGTCCAVGIAALAPAAGPSFIYFQF
ncbi:MBOAT family protein [Myxococcota bacterium]|nr:MBOAT family protein [Myxococcota bacterium]